MTDPTLPPVQKGNDKTLPTKPPLSEQEKFEDIFKTIDVDTNIVIDPPYDAPAKKEAAPSVSPQEQVPQLKPQESLESVQTENPVPPEEIQVQPKEEAQLKPQESLQDVQTENPVPETKKNETTKQIAQDLPPVEPELTGIKDISSYIAKAKENQSKKIRRLEAEDGTDLTKLPGLYAVVPHTKGDHKLIYTVGEEPKGLIDDPKKRIPGTSYVKNNELIYDVWVTMKKHPTLKNERNEPLDVWLIDSPDQLTQQLASIAIGKGGGTNFSAPVICKTVTPPSKKNVTVTTPKPASKPKEKIVSTPTPGAQATVTTTQPKSPPQKEERPVGLSPETKKTIKDTMAEKEKGNAIPASLSKNFPTKKEAPKAPVKIAPQPTAPKKEVIANTPIPPQPKKEAPKAPVKIAQETISQKESPPFVEPILEITTSKKQPAILEDAARIQAPLPNEVTITQATQENAQANAIVEQVTGKDLSIGEPPQEEIVIPTEHKEIYGDIVDLDSLDTQESLPEVKVDTKTTIDLEGLDAQFSPTAKKVVTHPKGSSVPLGMILRIIGVLIVIGMSRAMYTVMFPTVPQRPITTTPPTGDVLTDAPVGIVDTDETDTALTGAQENNTGTSGMPIKEEIEGSTPPTAGSFTLDELKAKLTAQQKQAQTIANKAKLLNEKDAIKFSIVSIRKAGEALKRIEEDPTITAEELTEIATKIDLYLQEAQLRIQ